jgi:cyclase
VLTKRIIPCLDVKDGRVVKGVQFLALVDAGDPVEVAAAYDAQGADELCFLDINASHENRGTMLDLVARTADRLTIPFSVGGGVRSLDDVRAPASGRGQGVGEPAAVARPELVAETAEKSAREPDRRIDARRKEPGDASHWEVYTTVGARRASTPSRWAARIEKRSARARSCSPAWTATARATATTWHSHAQ